MADWNRQIGAMTLCVPDLRAAREFYASAFKVEAQQMDENSLMLRFGEMFVFLRKIAAPAPPAPEVAEEGRKGAGQFAIIVGDVDAVCAEIAERGVFPLAGPADRDWGMRTATYADPAGHIWEIAQELPADDA